MPLALLVVLAACAGSETEPDDDSSADSDGGTDADTDVDTDADTDTDIAASCAERRADFEAELFSVQHCTSAAECGQILAGTSCGCTRELVARTDADTTGLHSMMDEAAQVDCDLGLGSACDCPDADGFACVEEKCVWNYLPSGCCL